jgi:hypothetical protein
MPIQIHPSHWGFYDPDTRRPFVPWGCNYFDPFTGWAPQLWRQFDPGRVAQHFADIRAIGGNIVRVFSTVGCLLAAPDLAHPDGVEKMARMLDLAWEQGIRVIWSGPSLWEGAPEWWREAGPYEGYARPDLIAAMQTAWRAMGAAFRGHPGLFAYELHNEPFAPSAPTPALRERWARWRAAHAPGAGEDLPAAGPTWDWEFQRFREDIATEYTARMVEAIRGVDDTHLITFGLHQKSAPFDWYPPDPYAAFNPYRLNDLLDYHSIHFYPHHIFHPDLYRDPYETEEGMRETLWHARAVMRYFQATGKPLVLEECGWYGGGSVEVAGREQPERSEADQTRWCRGLVEATRGDACGWLFWPYRDTPSSLDASRRSGLYNAAGELKDWGKTFAALAPAICAQIPARAAGTRKQPLDLRALVTDPGAVKAFRAAYLDAFRRGETVDFDLI